MRKRILSILLTLCMVLCLIPTAVFAEAAPTGTPLTQALLGTWLEKEDPYNPNSGKIYKMPSGNYFLAEDIYLVGDDADPNSAWPLIISEGAVTLDLNGHVLDLKKKVINIHSAGILTLTDSNPNAEHKFRVEDSGLWVWDESGDKTVAGGVITGGAGVSGGNGAVGIHGGGVNVSGGSLTMEGGSIVGCTANSGGGVSVLNYGSFTMKDGRIAGCTAVKSGNSYGNGGVSVFYGGSFTMAGGSIADCTASETGGGVDACGNRFTMNGGSIKGCTANNGGGIYVQSNSTCILTMTGGSIEGCTAEQAGGVFVAGGSFTMEDGSITNCTAGGAANAVHADGSFTSTGGSADPVTGSSLRSYGEAANPILIATTEGLKDFRDLVNNGETSLCARLTADIVLNNGTFDENGNWSEDGTPEQWTPIGTDTNPYTGTFDGGGHTIKGLYVDVTGIAGLFGEIGGATIRDVTVDGYVKGTLVAGGIAGMASNSATSIQNCVNRCYVVATNGSSGNAGGIVGAFSDASISGCANIGTVSGTNYVGGIAGFATGGGISSCYNTGAVSGNTSVGGVAGYASTSTVSSCYNTGTVSGTNRVGGIAGTVAADAGTKASITSCYNTGAVSGDEQVGGIVGRAFVDNSDANTSITSCCYLTGTAKLAVGEIVDTGIQTHADARTKTEFADGTVLALLKGDRTDSPWADECQYLVAAGMTLPVFKGQGDSHEHSEKTGSCLDGIYCECGYLMHRATSEHNWGEWTSNGNDTHSHRCQNAGCTASETDNCSGGTATCTDKARCELCGEKYGEVDLNNHGTLNHLEAKAATENAQGNIEYWHCVDCDRYFKDSAGTQEITVAETVTEKLSAGSGNTPKLGDNGGLVLWLAMLLISEGAVIGTTVIGKKKKYSQKH